MTHSNPDEMAVRSARHLENVITAKLTQACHSNPNEIAVRLARHLEKVLTIIQTQA